MKLVLAVCLIIGVVAAQKYTTKYDNINLDDILKSERLLNNYFNCLMDKGKCTPDGNELKRTLPDALKTDCSKCSEKQKAGTERVLRFLIEKKPNQYAELQKKYDPEGIYYSKYEKEAEARGIKV
ncbi:ejaculatory bulb-specific protein 3 [Chironomus tepperi]|uniref:ejaculatory bulb-specific protein 3 n=1 Tax=Chironomus tepperi TaxID=113505 RepID=UPI00391F6D02